MWPSLGPKVGVLNSESVLKARPIYFERDTMWAKIQSTQCVFFNVPPTPRFFMSMDSHDQLNCPLIWAILKPWGPEAVVRVGNTWLITTCPGDKLFVHLVWQPKPYLRTNNATKWQINKTTVNSNVHFTVDAIMYMTTWRVRDSQYTMY